MPPEGSGGIRERCPSRGGVRSTLGMTMARSAALRSLSVRRPRVIASAIAVVAAAVVAMPGSAGATATLNTCDATTFRNAVLAGGTVTFAVDCPALAVSPAIIIPAALNVTINGNGHAVVLDAKHLNRHFTVNGGRLTITGLELRNGLVTGATPGPAAAGPDNNINGGFGPTGGGGQDGACTLAGVAERGE